MKSISAVLNSVAAEIIRPNSRLSSYDNFRDYFYKFREQGSSNYDEAAVQLGFYLASWGMYRGSSFLLNYNYKIHVDVVKTLASEEYFFLVDADAPKYLDPSSNAFELLKKLEVEISNSYQQLAKHQPTVTLITKIILGTHGCIPAFDRFLRDGLKKVGLPHSTYSDNSKRKLFEWIEIYAEEFDQAASSNPALAGYSQMKLVDLYLWKLGKPIS